MDDGFVRPELRAAFWRWREVVAGLAVSTLGAVVATGRVGLIGYLGWAMIAVGLALVYSGIARWRFRNVGGGRGVVEVDEGAVRYFGPDMGGALALPSISRIAITPSGWELSDEAGQRLTIPVDAEGAEALFDAFVTLPGMSGKVLADAAARQPARRTIIWKRAHGSRS